MSELPRRPSLTHLRKQAKDLLRRLRHENPDTTLAQAQHAVAREYGFGSWPKLKAQVERLVALPQAVAFQRYTPKAREAVFFSRFEASQRGSRTLEPEHIVLGVIRASQGLRTEIFDKANVSPPPSTVEAPAEQPNGALLLTNRVSTGERAQEVFRAAAEEADLLKHRDIGLVHLLLGVLRAPDSASTALLDQMGVRHDSVRDRISLLLNEDPL